MFKGRERMTAIVNRWSTTPRIHQQSVAEHSFFVTLYTAHLCDILKWPKIFKAEALQWALIHDIPEAVTSDIPGPVKRIISDAKQLAAMEKYIFDDLNYAYHASPEAKAIVKAANLIDEVFYLQFERIMGNGFVDLVYQNSWQRMVKALENIKADHLVIHIKMEIEHMGHGVVGLKNDDDLNG